MRCILVAVVLAAFISLATAQTYSPEEQQIVDQVRSSWKSLAKGDYDAIARIDFGMTPGRATAADDRPVIEASSDGGLWEISTSRNEMEWFKENEFILRAAPHHIHVLILGSARDVAHVSYYLVGTIPMKGGESRDYRTRVSQVLEKVNGKWVIRGAHYSPLFGGVGL